MKKIIPLILLLAVQFNSCKKDQYADLREHYNDILKINETYADRLESAKTGKEAGLAFKEYIDSLVKLDESEKTKRLVAKYDSDFKNLKEDELHPGIKDDSAMARRIEKFKQRMDKIEKAKIEKFMDDPEFQRILEESAKAIQPPAKGPKK